ncbi:LbetaH domain-containing protein [Chachezhania sediminis]|uniref:chloramphenicol acetyltransferase n=1 Tax=Chachezhania sediminis TaxID=2599291 RepID=UPI00131BB303|nr:chloramphenicol acetyltransferase [Chachezhania sediminis]
MSKTDRLSAGTPRIHEDCAITESRLGGFVEIGRMTRIAHSSVGDYSYCDRFCDIANAEIGKFANIASCVRIGATDHPLDRASLHHFLYRSASYWEDTPDDAAWFEKRRARRTAIGHDTWIGHNAQIKPDVTVGHGAVVAAGAVVTKNVDPYTIVAGLPAKPIRRRQHADIAERLIALAWWDWPHDALHDALEDFRNMSVEAFLEKYE